LAGHVARMKATTNANRFLVGKSSRWVKRSVMMRVGYDLSGIQFSVSATRVRVST